MLFLLLLSRSRSLSVSVCIFFYCFTGNCRNAFYRTAVYDNGPDAGGTSNVKCRYGIVLSVATDIPITEWCTAGIGLGKCGIHIYI